jgi:hypothetical protein
MRIRAAGLIPLLVVALAQGADAQPRTPRVVGLGGIGVLLSPGVIAGGSNGAGSGELLEATLRDDLALVLALGVESRWIGLEFRMVTSARELQVRNQTGESFPHHASHPVFWTAGVTGFPVQVLRLRPFVVIGGGGMLVSEDLDNVRGASLHHSWQTSIGAGIRWMLGDPDPRSGVSLAELRLTRSRVGAAGRFRRTEVQTITFSLGLSL